MAFKTLYVLNSKIVDDITTSWSGRHPENILSQLEEEKPWAVFYTTSNTYVDVMKQVSLDHKETIVFDENRKPIVKTFNWSENNGVLTDGTIQCYVHSLDAFAFAYYICDIQGPPGPPQGGVAIALGPPGGIPNETLYTASCMKKSLKKMKMKLNITCDINIPDF